MNKKGQQADIADIIKLIFALVIIIPFIGVMFSLINSMNPQCPTCDYSSYETAIKNCTELVDNLTRQLNETPVQYVQNVTYVEVPVEKIVYKERFIPITLNILALIFSIGITISLFKIEIRLPKEMEDRLRRIEDAIRLVKIGSLFVSIILFIRLIFIALALF